MSAITVRLEGDLHKRLKEAARADRRSLNSECLHLWEEALRNRDTKKR